MTIWTMWPLVKLAESLTRLLTKGKEKGRIHREEFIALARLGAREGVFHKYESRILNNLFCFRDVRTRDIMTPRTVLFALAETLTVEETLAAHAPVALFTDPHLRRRSRRGDWLCAQK
jgi:CBS domain containing-hemolysin-like protein